MQLIGIGGTNGAGKDTVAKILADDYGWLFISVTDILRNELKKRDLPIERENLRALSAEWRREYGIGHLIDEAVKLFDPKKYKGLVVASLRNPGEAERVHELGGQVVWVDAEPQVRYQRIYSRARSAEDRKTFEQFLAEEQAEMHSSGDEATLNMAGVKDKADIFITNNGDLDAVKAQVQKDLNL